MYPSIQRTRKEGLCIVVYKGRKGYVSWYTREGEKGVVYPGYKGRKSFVSWYAREGRVVYPGIQGKEG